MASTTFDYLFSPPVLTDPLQRHLLFAGAPIQFAPLIYLYVSGLKVLFTCLDKKNPFESLVAFADGLKLRNETIEKKFNILKRYLSVALQKFLKKNLSAL